MKYLFWLVLTAFAITVLATEVYVCKWEDGDYVCKLISEPSPPIIEIDLRSFGNPR